MLTPIDIQNHSLKTAVRGYSKKETDDFLEEIIRSYEEVYKENRDLKDKVASLSDGIQYYKGMESTLQKALVLAEKTSSETQEAAKSKAEALMSETEARAEAITKEAKAEAEALRKETLAFAEVTKAKAKQELEETRNHVRKLVQSYENYRLQFKKLAESQIEMLESEHYSIFAPELKEMLDSAPNADEAMDADELVALNAGRKLMEREEELEKNEAEKETDASQEITLSEEENDVAVEEDTIAVSQEVISDSFSVDSETEPDAILVPETEEQTEKPTITGDDMYPPMDDEVASMEERFTESNGSWVNTTPRVDDKSHEEVTKTVEPKQKKEEDTSPFTFIDTE